MKLLALSTLILATPLFSQGLFKNAEKPGEATCDRILRDADNLNTGGVRRGQNTTAGLSGAATNMAWYRQQGERFFAPGTRKNVGEFNAIDEKGKSVSIASLKGKIVLVGFWSANCEPSGKMMMEMADLYSKREKFNFEILAVNFDENRPEDGIVGGWGAVQKFKTRNAAYFKQNPIDVYTPGIGAQGPSNFVDMVWSLPMLCVVDREGNLASMTIGYTPNFVANNLKRVLVERTAAPAAPAKPAPANPAPAN